ncbi:DUF4159 domain-containing protein [Rhizosaccharibacter radicis]|uniref:DUF4159 domain-containing protein n=1 Tax=Rhizosaccharibacter radicis TaxID=2782605 RepID=A0ABT1VXF2_9PROT|nr:DUF4159 domain-containing protein [Acetobacteraceae bacterium KSS12]
MILLHPWLLLALLVLPVLWWLLRAVPPPARRQPFPAIRLLHGLTTPRQEARRAPWWLLALRLLAVALVVVGLAQPVLVRAPRAAADRTGGLLLVLDDGWASAPDWQNRLAAARELAAEADRQNAPVSLLLTAPDGTGAPPSADAPATGASVLHRLEGLRPMPWPVDRAAAAAGLPAAMNGIRRVSYLSDGLATGIGDDALRRALARIGTVSELRDGPDGVMLAGSPRPVPDGLVVPARAVPAGRPRPIELDALNSENGVLAHVGGIMPAGAGSADLRIQLPPELRNQIGRLAIPAMPGAGGIRLLDESSRRRPVGLLSSGGGDTPLVGNAFFLRRALAADSDLREGDVSHLLAGKLSVLIAPDGTLQDPADRKRVAAWVRGGGMLIRFAGPRLAAEAAASSDASAGASGTAPGPAHEAAGPSDTDEDATPDADPGAAPDASADPLLPVPLLDGSRQLGGSMSWGRPEHLAPFNEDSPFRGLPVPADATVSRQVLAQPGPDLSRQSWATLADNTPLVTHRALGAGQLVLFHVSSTADWSSLPLSGMFPAMLRRLVQRAAGVSAPGGDQVLSPVSTLDGDGVPGPPPPASRGLPADRFGQVAASVRHPAGFYGALAERRALSVGDALPALAVAPPMGRVADLRARVADRSLGPSLLTAAIMLLCADVLAVLLLRGGLGRMRGGGAAALVVLIAGLATATGSAVAAAPAPTAAGAAGAVGATDAVPRAALETRLAYVVTGDDAVDTVSRQGLSGLATYVNARTSARLGQPDGVVPGRDDLAFYPLLYWPITARTVPPGAAAISALNSFMRHGGILLIDTQGDDAQGNDGQGGTAAPAGGGFTGYAPGAARALRRAAAGLDIPALRPVDDHHVLSRTFYLLHDFPGRFDGNPVWVARDDDAGNDGVSPVIIGGNDWAAAWAVDANGDAPYAVIPGGDTQRTMAFRFGVNAVIYALTGNYKADQVHVPALLHRLGN